MPEKLLCSCQFPVRITDINYGNHLGNDAVVRLLQETRMQWLTGLGFTELEIGGAGLIMADLAVEFKKEAFYGDILRADLYVGDIAKVSFALYILWSISMTRL